MISSRKPFLLRSALFETAKKMDSEVNIFYFYRKIFTPFSIGWVLACSINQFRLNIQ